MPGRRFFLLGGAALCLLPGRGAQAAESLRIGAGRGTIEFAIGDSSLFRTTGSFTQWQGTIKVDDADPSRSSVAVKVATASISLLDAQQTSMLKEADFFHVARFPEMTYVSKRIERQSESALKVEGDITLRGITRPMLLDVSVTDRRPDAPAGATYARFNAKGKLQRSEFGMVKFVDIVGDTVDFTIRTDAWR
ncbi:MAG: YceI family protein [Enhydrobacter sp.]|nr:YceI family protein [Enhydrobacter sp.]